MAYFWNKNRIIILILEIVLTQIIAYFMNTIFKNAFIIVPLISILILIVLIVYWKFKDIELILYYRKIKFEKQRPTKPELLKFFTEAQIIRLIELKEIDFLTA